MPTRGEIPRVLRVFAAVLCASAASAAAPAEWQAGTAREDITPPEPLWMTGYAVRTRPAEGTAQRLWAKALAFSDPAGRRSVLVTADLCGITRAVTDRVARELERRHGLPRSAVLFNVSHTHSSPWIDGYLEGLRLLPPEARAQVVAYRRSLEESLLRVASAALVSLAPASLAWAEDEATFGINRRNNAAKDASALRAAGQLRGPVDPRVPVLAVRSADGALRALLVSYACHNTTLSGYVWHGDYAGSAQLELERRHPGALALFAIGCAGDINPHPRGQPTDAEAHGRGLADAADRALAKPLAPVEGTFASAWADLELTFARRPSEAEIRAIAEKEQPNREMYQAWAHTVGADLAARGDAALRQPYPIQVWRLGPLAWIALGGEPVVEYSLRLRRELGAQVWVFGYSNDVMCYIPDERVLREGRYEGDTSMIAYGKPSPWTPGLEEKIVTQARELVAATRAAP